MRSQFKKLYLRALERARQAVLKYIGPRPVWATQNPLSKQNKRRGLEEEKQKSGRGREGGGGEGWRKGEKKRIGFTLRGDLFPAIKNRELDLGQNLGL